MLWTKSTILGQANLLSVCHCSMTAVRALILSPPKQCAETTRASLAQDPSLTGLVG